MRLKIFYSQTSDEEIQFIQRALTNTYEDALDVTVGEELDLIEEAYNSQRNQYNADILLKHLLNRKNIDTRYGL